MTILQIPAKNIPAAIAALNRKFTEHGSINRARPGKEDDQIRLTDGCSGFDTDIVDSILDDFDGIYFTA